MECRHCGKTDEREVVTCQACGYTYCRKRCWRFHLCGTPVDRYGQLVVVGDTVRYYQTDRVYQISATPPGYAKGGAAFGKRIGKRQTLGPPEIIRPHLMEKVMEE